jgi:hypothetical protein
MRVQHLSKPVASGRLGAVWAQGETPPPVRPHRWVAAHPRDEWSGEFWETLSYAILWLCGLIGIGLCFLGPMKEGKP